MKKLFARLFGGLRSAAKQSTPVASAAPPVVVEPEPEPKQPVFNLATLIRTVRSLNLTKQRATILLYLDRSISTNEYPNRLWADGTVQLLLVIVVAIANVFSVTNKAVLRFFHDSVVRPIWPIWPEAGQLDHYNAHQIITRNKDLGFQGTHFIPVLLDMVRQALLLDAQTRSTVPEQLSADEALINKMADAELLRFITPEIIDGKEQLKPLLKLPHPICGVLGTDGESPEEIELLLQILRWMSQLGIYVMLIGMGNYDFRVLKGMDKAGEDLFMKKGLKPLWDNADFFDLKDLTNGEHRVPDGTAVVRIVVSRFMERAYTACRRLQLTA